MQKKDCYADKTSTKASTVLYWLQLFVYVRAQEEVKFEINFTSCRENINFAVITTMSGIYPNILHLPMLSL